MRRTWVLVVITALLTVGFGPSDPTGAKPLTDGPARAVIAPVAPPRLSVRGNKFRINGTRTRLIGQSLVVVASPRGLIDGGVEVTYPPSVAEARALYRRWSSPRAFFDRVRSWARGTNTVRLQVSQFGLAATRAAGDPVCDRPCRRDYLSRIDTAVQAAKDAGLVVILSMQYQRLAGGANDPRWRLPTTTTYAAWRRLAARFANDRSVAFEVYNEPQGPPSSGLWDEWRTTHRKLLRIIREQKGAVQNVVIVDGLAYSQRWDGYRRGWLTDDRLAFAIHAYPGKGQDTRAEWIPRWNPVIGPGPSARLMNVYPTLITEWSADSLGSGYCSTDDTDGVLTAAAALDLLRWLRDQRPRVGLLGWSFDIPSRHGFTVDAGLTPASLSGFTCGQAGSGPGWKFKEWAAGRLG